MTTCLAQSEAKGDHIPCPLRGPSAGTMRVAPTVGEIIGAFKSITTHNYMRGVKQFGWHPFAGKLWQRNYYEHILRDETDWERISVYIADNPLNWVDDQENPVNVS